jgi:hypothetical protein
MRLHDKVVVAMWQRPTTVWAFALATGARPGVVMLKFITSEDHHVAL